MGLFHHSRFVLLLLITILLVLTAFRLDPQSYRPSSIPSSIRWGILSTSRKDATEAGARNSMNTGEHSTRFPGQTPMKDKHPGLLQGLDEQGGTQTDRNNVTSQTLHESKDKSDTLESAAPQPSTPAPPLPNYMTEDEDSGDGSNHSKEQASEYSAGPPNNDTISGTVEDIANKSTSKAVAENETLRDSKSETVLKDKSDGKKAPISGSKAIEKIVQDSSKTENTKNKADAKAEDDSDVTDSSKSKGDSKIGDVVHKSSASKDKDTANEEISTSKSKSNAEDEHSSGQSSNLEDKSSEDKDEIDHKKSGNSKEKSEGNKKQSNGKASPGSKAGSQESDSSKKVELKAERSIKGST